MPSTRKISVFAVATMLFWFSLYTYVPILPTYSQDMGATPIMLGLIVGSYGFAQMIFRIPLGVMSDWLRTRKAFITGGILMSLLGAAGLLFSRNSIMLLTSRFTTGIAAAAWVQFTVLFSSYYPRNETQKAIGYINAFCNAGQMAAMLLGGAATDFNAGAPFIMAVIAALIAFIISLFIYEKSDNNSTRSSFRQLITVFKERKLLVASGLAVFAQMAAFATVFAFTPVHAKGIGAGSSELGFLSTIASLPAILTSMYAGSILVKKIGLKKTIAIGFFLTAVTYSTVPFTETLLQLYIIQFIGGAGRGVLMPMLMGAGISDIDETKRATAMGFFQAVYSIGMFSGPVISGAISGLMGYTAGFVFIGAISVVAGILTFRLIR